MGLFGFNDPALKGDLICHFFIIEESLREVAGKEIDSGTALAEDVLEILTVDASGVGVGEAADEVRALIMAWFFVSSSARTDMMVLNPFWVLTARLSFFFHAP